jgi:FtsH-binding integral membrane protein
MYPGNPGTANINPYGSYASPLDFPDVFRRVYLWLAVGLTVGFGVAWAVGAFTSAQIAAGQDPILFNPIVWIGTIVVYLGLGFTFGPIVYRSSPAVGSALFILLTAVFGLMAASIFVAYTAQSIAAAFFITATMFALMTLIGFTTSLDLSKFGAVLLMGLIGLIVASVVNIFLHSGALFWIVSVVGILLFCALTAYDTQWIKRNAIALGGKYGIAQEELVSRVALIGAFRLFLDFVNLFIFILNLTGRRR